MKLTPAVLPLALLFVSGLVTLMPPVPRPVSTLRPHSPGLVGYLDNPPGIRSLRITIDPGSRIPQPCRMVPDRGYLVEGELHVEVADGTWRTIRPGDALGDDMDMLHRGVAGDAGATVLVFYSDVLAHHAPGSWIAV